MAARTRYLSLDQTTDERLRDFCRRTNRDEPETLRAMVRVFLGEGEVAFATRTVACPRASGRRPEPRTTKSQTRSTSGRRKPFRVSRWNLEERGKLDNARSSNTKPCPSSTCGWSNNVKAAFCAGCGALLLVPPAAPDSEPSTESHLGAIGFFVAIFIASVLLCCVLISTTAPSNVPGHTVAAVSTSQQPTPEARFEHLASMLAKIPDGDSREDEILTEMAVLAAHIERAGPPAVLSNPSYTGEDAALRAERRRLLLLQLQQLGKDLSAKIREHPYAHPETRAIRLRMREVQDAIHQLSP